MYASLKGRIQESGNIAPLCGGSFPTLRRWPPNKSCVGPIRTKLTKSQKCTKTGYFPAQRTIDHSLSGTGIADIIGTAFFLLPGIGLFTAGAWKTG